MTYTPDAILRLVDLIYEAATKPPGWSAFLEAFADTIDGHTASLAYINPGNAAVSIATPVRWDPQALHLYSNYFNTVDPWARQGVTSPEFRPGAVKLSEEIVPWAQFQTTEFFNDFGRHYEVFGGMTGIILRDGDSAAIINAIHRRDRAFGNDELALVRTLIPHLQRALTIHQRLHALEEEREASAAAIAAIPSPAVVTDTKGRVVLITAIAEAILRRADGLRVRRGALVAASARENAELQMLIAQCCSTTTGAAFHAGGAMTVTCPSGRRSLHVLVSPLRARNRFAPAGTAGAIIFISDPEQQAEPSEQVLRRLYSLTAAETRVAVLLASGLSVREITHVLDITENTARGYLKNISSKMGARTQAQIVRLVLSVPRQPSSD